jgi:iron complex transport system substrate-binding protein
MRDDNKIIFYCLIISYASIFTGCRQSAVHSGIKATSVNVTDFRGREIALSKPASRIVCLVESALSGIYMLNAADRVIGVPSDIYTTSTATQYALLDDRIRNKKLPSPGNWDFASIENIVALQPDLVIIWASQTESIASIEGHGIPVYAVFLKSFNDIYKEIRDFGVLTGTSHRADSLIMYTDDEITKLRSTRKSSNIGKKSVYFVWPQGLLETAGTTSTVNELIELAGAKNSCPVPQEHVAINKEYLYDWNPDIIVMWFNSSENPDNIIESKELGYLDAVSNRQVFEFPSVFLCDLWTLKFPYAAKLMAKWCYPSLYADLNPDYEMRKMLTELYGEKGVSLAK